MLRPQVMQLYSRVLGYQYMPESSQQIGSLSKGAGSGKNWPRVKLPTSLNFTRRRGGALDRSTFQLRSRALSSADMLGCQDVLHIGHGGRPSGSALRNIAAQRICNECPQHLKVNKSSPAAVSRQTEHIGSELTDVRDWS